MSEKQLGPDFKIFSLNGNQPLAEKIAKVVGVELGKCEVRQFSDGEIQINVEESIRGSDVYLVQSTSYPVNDHLWELLIMVDAMKRASARTVNVVMPYFGYARQDRTAKPREPITAKLVANMLQRAGVTRVLTLDLHAVQVQGFFDIPVDNLFTMPLFAQYYQDKGMTGDDIVVVSPKNSGVKRARELSNYLDASLAIVDQHSQQEAHEDDYVIGNVAGKTCILVDDMINNGTTLAIAAKVIQEAGAKEIYACASHGLFSSNAVQLLEEAPIKEVCVTDSIDRPLAKQPQCLQVITCASLMGEGLRRIHENIPMSPLFKL